MLDSDIAVLGPPERLEPLPKRNNAGQHFRIILDVWMEERDATHARGLLRVHSERPHRRAAKRDNEFSLCYDHIATEPNTNRGKTRKSALKPAFR
jgi:hypothetical protein